MIRSSVSHSPVDRWVASALGRRSLLILTYHGVRPDDDQSPLFNWQGKHVSQSSLAAQVDWLDGAGYRFIGGDELRRVARREQLPRGPAVAITFDDGYANNYTAGLPILRKRSIPAVLFLVGTFIARGEPLWVDRLEQAFARTTAMAIDVHADGMSRTFPLRTLSDRKEAEASIRTRCKRLAATDRDRVLRHVYSQLAGPSLPMPALYDPLAWDQIDELRDVGWEIGSHTMTHTVLSALGEEAARCEVGDAKGAVEGQLGTPCDLFAYPNGQRGDFTPATRHLLSELGMTCALTSIEGRVSRGFDPFAMRRVAVHDRMGLDEFKLRTTGAVGMASSMKAGLRTAVQYLDSRLVNR